MKKFKKETIENFLKIGNVFGTTLSTAIIIGLAIICIYATQSVWFALFGIAGALIQLAFAAPAVSVIMALVVWIYLKLRKRGFSLRKKSTKKEKVTETEAEPVSA